MLEEGKKICGRCKKPKGKGKEFCKCGRPAFYNEKMPDRVREYLKKCKDRRSAEGTRVNLPTTRGLAVYLGINRDTVFEWGKNHEQFSDSLAEFLQEQHDRLLNKGLSGEYNSTIAKLVLSSNHGYAENSKNTTTHNGEIKITSEKKAEIDNALNDI